MDTISYFETWKLLEDEYLEASSKDMVIDHQHEIPMIQNIQLKIVCVGLQREHH